MFKDGSLGASTALLFEPYEHRPDTTGLEVLSGEQLESYPPVHKCRLRRRDSCHRRQSVANTLDVLESCRTESIRPG